MSNQYQYKLKSTIKYPTSLIINGISNLGLEIADSLLAQGGYVILVDSYNEQNLQLLEERLGGSKLVSFLDYTAIPHLEEDIRRLDYVFYLGHEGGYSTEQVSTQTFLKYSNYLDTTLSLAGKFEAKFLLTTSIRAHQMLMSRMDFDVNFGAQADAKHTVYTEMEVQRYAESLCMEYVTKTELNARIVRLGEIIGEGMDFTQQNNMFVQLVMSAIRGEELVLAGDGLETEWFVHLLDAAYGVIKAQFSKDTKGDIFSLAYENSVTHLSLAYKLQEIEPLAREITFREAEMSSPPLRFHKPAPNLSKIGWKPRIDFDKSVNESLAAAKLFAISNLPTTGRGGEQSSVVGKLKSFFSTAAHAPTPAELEMLNSGPVSRLIAERKRQEQDRIDSLGRADSEIKSKWRDRPRTPGQRLKAWVWRNFLDVRTNFSFLRNMTPGQFFLYSLLFAFSVWVYFAVFSPVVVIVRNIVVAYSTLPELETALGSYDFGQVYQGADQIQAGLRENSQLLKQFEDFSSLIAADRYLASMISFSEVYANAFEGLRDLGYAVEPLGDYLNEYQDNVWARGTAESYLSVNDTGRDYSPVLDEMTARSAYADVGASKYDQAVLQMETLDISLWPEPLQAYLQSYTKKLANLSAISNYRQIADFANEILGLNSPMTYLILVLDNSRPMPIGGEISAYMLVTVQNGAIADVRVQSIDSFTAKISDLPSYTLSAINLLSSSAKQAGDITMHDLAKIKDYDIFRQVVSDIWGAEFNRQVDAVLVTNYTVLGSMLDIVGGVELEGVRFDSNSLLSNLSILQAEVATTARRNDLVAQLFARSWDSVLDNYQQRLIPLLQVLASAAQKKDLVFPSSDLSFDRAADQAGIQGMKLDGADLPVSIFLVSDQKVISPERYPALSYATKVRINSDTTVNYTTTAKFPAISNVDSVVLCTSLVAPEITVSGIDAARVTTHRYNNDICKVADTLAETELTFSWTTVQFESLDNSEYNIVLGQSKQSGVEVISDFEITLSAGLSFQNIQPDIPRIEGRAVFTETLSNDRLIDLLIRK